MKKLLIVLILVAVGIAVAKKVREPESAALSVTTSPLRRARCRVRARSALDAARSRGRPYPCRAAACVRTCTQYSPVMIAQSWGSGRRRGARTPATTSSHARGRGAQHQRPGRNDPRTSSRLRPGARTARQFSATITGPDTMPHTNSNTPGDDEEQRARPSPRSRRPTRRARNAPQGTVRDELAAGRAAGAVQVVADHLLGRGRPALGDEQLEDEHDQPRRRAISTRSKWSVSMRTSCATPASSITASGSQAIAASPLRNQTWRRHSRAVSRRTVRDPDRGDGQSEDPTVDRVAEIAS